MSKFAVIMPAAGSSTRFGDANYKKPFALLGGKPVWLHSAERFTQRDDVAQFLMPISAEDREFFGRKYGASAAMLGVSLVEGGANRAASVANALAQVQDDVDFVCVHDAARPLLAAEWIEAIFSAVERLGAVIYASPLHSTIKRVDAAGRVQETIPRDGLYAAQTPQVFRREMLIRAHAADDAASATDDAQLVERLGETVHVLPGSPLNFKITTKEDLRFAEHALKALPKPKLEGPAHPFADDLWR